MDIVDIAQKTEIDRAVMFRGVSAERCLQCGITFKPHLLEGGLCFDCDMEGPCEQ